MRINEMDGGCLRRRAGGRIETSAATVFWSASLELPERGEEAVGGMIDEEDEFLTRDAFGDLLGMGTGS